MARPERRLLPVALLLALGGAGAAQVPAPSGEPRTSDVTERVRVRLVLIDALVLDRKGRIVPNLTRDDFDLLLDYDPLPIDSVDFFCPAGAAADPRPVEQPELRRGPVAPGVPRRIVLAFDYMHLDRVQRYDVVQRVLDSIEHAQTAADEVMVAAITDILRVEQSFTGDPRQVAETLRRMQEDITLWEPPFDHLHDLRFFRGLIDLVDLMQAFEGSKAIVLYSNLPTSASNYDPQFQSVAARAAATRTVFYPVYARGLTTHRASPRLARLAVETGGRYTERTNDFSLGYARAQRDLACRYTIGFYDPRPDADRAYRITLKTKRRKVRVHHADAYRFRDAEAERRATVRNAHNLPDRFRRDGVRAELIPLRPAGAKRWEALIALRLPIRFSAGPGGEAAVEFSTWVRKGNTTWHRSRRPVTLRPVGPAASVRAATIAEPVRLRPGRYTVSAVASGEWALAAGAVADPPAIPTDAPFLVPPRLVRRDAAQVRVTEAGESAAAPEHEAWLDELEAGEAEGPAESRSTGSGEEPHRPLVGASVEATGETLALTRVCRVGRRDEPVAVTVDRRWLDAAGVVVAALPPRRVDLEPGENVRCHTLLDPLPLGRAKGSQLVYEAALQGSAQQAPETVRMTVRFDATQPAVGGGTAR